MVRSLALLIFVLTAVLLIGCTNQASELQIEPLTDDVPPLAAEEGVEVVGETPPAHEDLVTNDSWIADDGPLNVAGASENSSESIDVAIQKGDSVDSLSVAEQYLTLMDEKVAYYAFIYKNDDYLPNINYESMFVFRKDDWRVITDFYWEVNTTKKTLVELNWKRFDKIADEAQEALDDDVENYSSNVVNYVWSNLTSGVTKACYVYSASRTLNSKNCVTYEDHQKTIIYENLKFEDEPFLPEDWLKKFIGRTPDQLDKGLTYTDERKFQTKVDRVKYETGQNTAVVMYVHSGYGIPLQVDLLKNGKVVEEIIFDYLTVNYPSTQRWHPDRLTP